jgi:hypothetical protein
MKKVTFLALPLLVLAALTFVMSPPANAHLIDADTLASGSYLASSPLIISTPYGNISFVGEIRGPDSDPEFTAAGASGHVFDIDENSNAWLDFSFEITSATFIYGGNIGVFDIEARDIGSGVVDSFYQASTDSGQPAGPITLSGLGIRQLYWEDPGYSFAAIDNLEITPAGVPEPATMLLFGSGLIGLFGLRRKFKKE